MTRPPPDDRHARWPAVRRPAAPRPGGRQPGPARVRRPARRDSRPDAEREAASQRARIAALWALALGRFRDYAQARRGSDMPGQEPALDLTALRRAYTELDRVVCGGGFGPPPPGEWDAEHLLAHIASADAAAASAALAIAAGLRPSYDNRVNVDESNLQRIIRETGGLPGLTDLVRQNGELLCSIAAQLSDEQL